MKSLPGNHYNGFLWFYFINEQLLRFLNTRYPRDYDTVPRLYFWLFHLLWLFPWSVYLPALTTVELRDRATAMERHELLAALLDGLRIGVLHVFDHPGILFDALFIRRSRFAAGVRHGGAGQLGSGTGRGFFAPAYSFSRLRRF